MHPAACDILGVVDVVVDVQELIEREENGEVIGGVDASQAQHLEHIVQPNATDTLVVLVNLK